MFSSDYKTTRLNLSKFLSSHPVLSKIEEVMDLCQDFDMIRAFGPDVVTVQEVTNYGVLEHIMRVTTTNDDIRPYAPLIAGDISAKISFILRSKEDTQQGALRDLEAAVSLQDIRALHPLPAFVTIYQFQEGHLRTLHIEPDEQGRWPILACLQADDVLGLLYNPIATCVDGYNPRSGEDITPILTEAMIDNFAPRLTVEQSRRTFSTQTKPPKKLQKLKMLSSIISGIPAPKPPAIIVVKEAKSAVSFIPQISIPVYRSQPKPVVELKENTSFGTGLAAPADVEIETVVEFPEEPQPTLMTFQRVQTIEIPSTQRAPPPTIHLHKVRVPSRPSKPCATEELVYQKPLDDREWPWVRYDKEAKKSSRSREGCGLGDDCELW